MHFVQELGVLVHILGALLNVIVLMTAGWLTDRGVIAERILLWPLAMFGAFACSYVVGLIQRIFLLGDPWPEDIRQCPTNFRDRVWRRYRWEAILWGCQKMDLPYNVLSTLFLLYYTSQTRWIFWMFCVRLVFSFVVPENVFTRMLPLPNFIEAPGQEQTAQ